MVPRDAYPDTYRCESCESRASDAAIDPQAEHHVSSWWSEAAATGASGIFGAFEEIYNPGAVRAREALKAEHERQIPKPTPGDDALKHGTMLIRLPRLEDVHPDTEE